MIRSGSKPSNQRLGKRTRCVLLESSYKVSHLHFLSTSPGHRVDRKTAKLQDIQSSLVAAQRQSRDLASENAHLETRATEALDQLEMAALDREVAEEKAEAAELEVSKLGERISEMEVEMVVLKEENGELSGPHTLLTNLSGVRETGWGDRGREVVVGFRAA